MDRIDMEEAGAWSKGIDYFEIAKNLARRVVCETCHELVSPTEIQDILGAAACPACYQRIQADLDPCNEEYGSYDRP